MSSYKLSLDAENDVFNIIAYTAEKWGEKQARDYSETLEACMESLALKEVAYKQVNEFRPPILVKHCQHHYIIGHEAEEIFLIIAVLHERMDFMSRISHRLKDG